MDHGCVQVLKCMECQENICYHGLASTIRKVLLSKHEVVSFMDTVKCASSFMRIFDDNELLPLPCQACVSSSIQNPPLFAFFNSKDVIFFARCEYLFANSQVKKVLKDVDEPETNETELEQLLETLQSGQCVISHGQYRFICNVLPSRQKKAKVSQCANCKTRKYMRLVYTCTSRRLKKKSRECQGGRCWKCWSTEVITSTPGLDRALIINALSIFTLACLPESPPKTDAIYKLISPVDCLRHESRSNSLLIEDLVRYKFQALHGFYPFPDGFCLSNSLFIMMAEYFDWNGNTPYNHKKSWELLKEQIFEWRDSGHISEDLAKNWTEGNVADYQHPKWTLVDDEEAEKLELSRFSYADSLELLCKNLGMGLALMDDPWEKFNVIVPAERGEFLVRFTIPRASEKKFDKIQHFFIGRIKEEDCKTVESFPSGDRAPAVSILQAQKNADDIRMGRVDDEEENLVDVVDDIKIAESSPAGDRAPTKSILHEQNNADDIRMGEVNDEAEEHLLDVLEAKKNLKGVEKPSQDGELEHSEEETPQWDISDEDLPQGITNGKNQDLEFLGLGHVDPSNLNDENQEAAMDDMKTIEVVGSGLKENPPQPVSGNNGAIEDNENQVGVVDGGLNVNLPQPVPVDNGAIEDNEDQVGVVNERLDQIQPQPVPDDNVAIEGNQDQVDAVDEIAVEDDVQNREPQAPEFPKQIENVDGAEQGNEDNKNQQELEVTDARNAPILLEKVASHQAKGSKQGNSSGQKKRNGRGNGKGGKGLGPGGGLKREIGCDDMPRIVPDYSASSAPEIIIGDRSATMTTCVFFLDGWVPEKTDFSFMVDLLKDVSWKFGRRITLSFSKNRRHLFKDLRFCANQTLIREVIVFGHGVQGPGETNGVLGAEVRISNKEALAREVVKFDEIIATFIRSTRSFQPDVGFICCNYFRRKKFGDHLKRRYNNAVSGKFQAMLTVCVEEDISLYQTTIRLPEILDSFISTKTFPFRFWKPSFKVQIHWRQFNMRRHEEEKLYILERLEKCKKHQIMCTNSSWLYQYLGLQWKDVNFDRFQIVHRMIRERQNSVKTKEWLHIE